MVTDKPVDFSALLKYGNVCLHLDWPSARLRRVVGRGVRRARRRRRGLTPPRSCSAARPGSGRTRTQETTDPQEIDDMTTHTIDEHPMETEISRARAAYSRGDLTDETYWPHVRAVMARHGIDPSIRRCSGGGGLSPAYGPCVVGRAYETVRNGWAQGITALAGEVAVCVSPGSPCRFADWIVGPRPAILAHLRDRGGYDLLVAEIERHD